jgi:hypothetical protein
MGPIAWVKAKLEELLAARRTVERNQKSARAKEDGTFEDKDTFRSKDFDKDYDAARRMLKARLDSKYPDKYHAMLRTGFDPLRDYAAERIDAVDKMSAAIADALREGASVKEAADRAARTIGL